MPILDEIQARESRETETQLRQADRDATWATTFANTPPTEVLRKTRNVTELVASALDRKMQLKAQTDEKAQEIFIKGRQFEQWEKEQPIREQLLAAQVESQGATTRFQEKKDAETMGDIRGFADGLATLEARPGTPEYRAGVLSMMRKYPRVVTTDWGKKTLTSIGEEDDMLSKVVGDAPEGFEVARLERGMGGKVAATYKPIADTSSKQVRANFYQEVKGLQLTPYAFENEEAWQKRPDGKMFYRDKDGDITVDEPTYTRLKQQYESLHGGTAAPTSAAPATTPDAVPAATAPPDVTPDQYSSLKPGDTYYWKGKALTKK